MKTVLRQLILLLVGCLPNIAFSAEKMDLATDSIASDTLASSVVLEDVVVKSDMVVNIKNGIAYYPTEAVKKIAFEIIDVMRMLPLTTAYIKDGVLYSNGTNEAAVYFIDGVQATDQDLKMLLPRDIKRVEVLQNPSEAKFMSKSFVVNITTKKVILGGYGKVNGSHCLLDKNGRGSVAAKAVSRKSDFIVNGGVSYRDVSDGTSRETIEYDFPFSPVSVPDNEPSENDDLRYVLNRESMVTSSGHRQFDASAAFQWRYTPDEGTRYLLSGGYEMYNQPSSYERGFNRTSLLLPGADSPVDSLTAFSEDSNWKMIASSVSFNFTKQFSSGILINALASFDYTYRNSINSYLPNTEIDKVDDIFNRTKQNSLSPNLSFYISIPLRKSRSVFAELSASEVFYDVNRSGTANISTNQRESNYSLFVGYRQYLEIKNDFLSYLVALTLPVNRFKYIDTHIETTLQYKATLKFNYSHKRLFSIDGTFNAQQLSRPSFYYSGISIQETDISGKVDNLDVKAPRDYKGTINFTFKLGKKFSVGGYVSHLSEYNSVVRDYFLKDNIVYSKMVNAGKYYKTDMRLVGSMRLLDDNLGFSVRAGFRRSERVAFSDKLWSPQGEISAYYANPKGWGVTAEYSLPSGKFHAGINRMVSELCNSDFSASIYYSNKNLSVRLSSYHLLNQNLKKKRYEITDNVRTNTISFSRNTSRLTLSISYLLDFGRRYAHDAEGVNPTKANAL